MIFINVKSQFVIIIVELIKYKLLYIFFNCSKNYMKFFFSFLFKNAMSIINVIFKKIMFAIINKNILYLLIL